MKQIMMRLWRVLRFPLLLSTIALPVPLALIMYCVPQLLPFVWVFPLCYLGLDLIGTRVRGKWRVLYSIAGVVFLTALGLLAASNTAEPLLLLLTALYAVLLVWGMVTPGAARYERIAAIWYVVGILVHIAAQLMLYSDRVTDTRTLDPVSPWITVSFYLFAALAMLSQNHASLSFAASGRQSVSETMRRKNAVLTLVFFGIAALLSLIPALASAVSAFFLWVISAVMWLISLLDRQNASGGAAQAGASNQGVNPWLIAGKSAPVWDILAAVAAVLAMVVLAVAVVFGLYKLIRKLPGVLHAVMRLLNRYVTAVSEDYVDEITDTRDFDDKERIMKRRRQSVDERKLPPDQRIRYRYLRLMVKYKWGRGSTARENLPEHMAPLYERVRYSDHAVTEEDAQRFAADAKRI